MAEESPDHLLKLRIGFIMDGVESVRSLQDSFPSLHSDLTYVTDPKFFDFGEDERIKLYKGDPLVIEVKFDSLPPTLPCKTNHSSCSTVSCFILNAEKILRDSLNGATIWCQTRSKVIEIHSFKYGEHPFPDYRK